MNNTNSDLQVHYLESQLKARSPHEPQRREGVPPAQIGEADKILALSRSPGRRDACPTFLTAVVHGFNARNLFSGKSHPISLSREGETTSVAVDTESISSEANGAIAGWKWHKPNVTIALYAALGCFLLSGCSKSSASKDAKTQSEPRSPTLTEIQKATVDEWFDRIGKEATVGYDRFSSLNALIHKAKESNAVKDEIMRKAEAMVDDPNQSFTKRFQSCYILSGIGDNRGIPTLLRALDDESSAIRGVAACALGAFDDEEAKHALKMAVIKEKNEETLGYIKQALDGKFLPKNH